MRGSPRLAPAKFADKTGADLSRRLFPVRRRIHRLHDLHDRLCARRRRRCCGAKRVLVPDRLERFCDAMGVAPRAGDGSRRRLHRDHSRRQRDRRGAAAVRPFPAAARDIGAGVRRRVLRGGGIDHRLRALQLSASGMAYRDRGDDDRVRGRPDAGADRGRRHHRRDGELVICAECFGADAGGGGGGGGVSAEAGANINAVIPGASETSEPGSGFGSACSHASRNDEELNSR